eukprot:1736048-Pyramimonas_sp.AAC.1
MPVGVPCNAPARALVKCFLTLRNRMVAKMAWNLEWPLSGMRPVGVHLLVRHAMRLRARARSKWGNRENEPVLEPPASILSFPT